MVGSAVAQQPPDTHGDFAYNPTIVEQGATINITGTCIWGGQPATDLFVDVSWPTSDPDGTIYGFHKDFKPGDDGKVVGVLEVPADARVGQYGVGALCQEDDQVFYSSLNRPLEVTEASTTTSTTLPPDTDPTTIPTTAAIESPSTDTTALPPTSVSTATTILPPSSTSTTQAERTGSPVDRSGSTRQRGWAIAAVALAAIAILAACGIARARQGRRHRA